MSRRSLEAIIAAQRATPRRKPYTRDPHQTGLRAAAATRGVIQTGLLLESIDQRCHYCRGEAEGRDEWAPAVMICQRCRVVAGALHAGNLTNRTRHIRRTLRRAALRGDPSPLAAPGTHSGEGAAISLSTRERRGLPRLPGSEKAQAASARGRVARAGLKAVDRFFQEMEGR